MISKHQEQRIRHRKALDRVGYRSRVACVDCWYSLGLLNLCACPKRFARRAEPATLLVGCVLAPVRRPPLVIAVPVLNITEPVDVRPPPSEVG